MEQNIVLTTELQEKFKSAWGQRQVILFTAPCGCGKSAAASVLLEPHTVCRWDALSDPPESAPDFACDAVLLDNLQALKSPNGQQALCALIMERPETHFVLLSRGPVPSWLASFRYDRRMQVFEVQDLLLDQETAEKLLALSGVSPTPAEMTAIQRSCKGYPLAFVILDPAVVKAAGDYTVTFSKEGHTSISKTFTVAKSGTQFVGDGEVKTYKDGAECSDFTAGDTITVKAAPTPTGEAPTNSAMFAASFTPPTTGQMAVFVSDTQVSAPVGVGADGTYTMEVSAADVLLAARGPGTEIPLTAKFVENNNMADGTGTVTVNITAVAKAERDGAVIGYYGESNLDKAFANDGATVTLLDNITTSMHVGVDTGNLTLDLNGKTITKPASYGLYVSGSGHLTIRGNGKVICTGTSGHYPEAITSLGGTLTLESGTFIGIMYGVHVRGETSVLSVTGESVSIQCEGCGLYISQAQSVELSAGTYEGGAAAIKIYGGTGTLAGLLNQEGASRVAYYKDNTTLVTEGLDGKELTGGSYTVKACTHIFGSSPTCLACGEQAVARVTIGDAVTHYGDLPSTWAAVQGQTADLYLLKSVDAAGVGRWGRLDLASGSVTLGMADGVVLSGSSNVVIRLTGGELTLNSGTIRNNGTTGNPPGLQVVGGTLRVSGGTVEANWAVYINGGHAEITGGTFTATGEYSVGLRKDEGTVKISGGQFSGSLYAVYNSNGTLADLLAEDYAFNRGEMR